MHKQELLHECNYIYVYICVCVNIHIYTHFIHLFRQRFQYEMHIHSSFMLGIYQDVFTASAKTNLASCIHQETSLSC